MDELFDWQKSCLAAWQENGCRGIVQAVTGSGKTRFALEAAGLLKDENSSNSLRVKIVVPSKPLQMQWAHAVKQMPYYEGEGSISLIGGGSSGKRTAIYEIYVINSARYRLARQIVKELAAGCDVFLIADECHRYTGEENRKIFEYVPELPQIKGNFYSLGLSATPQVPDFETVLIPALGKEIYRYGYLEALAHGTVCDFSVYQTSLVLSEEERAEYEELTDKMQVVRTQLMKCCPSLRYTDFHFFQELRRLSAGKPGEKATSLAGSYLKLSYQRKRLVSMAEARIPCACEIITRLSGEKRMLVFGESIEQVEALYQALTERGIKKVGRYHSGMGNQANRNCLERFRDGEFHILLSCRALDEGVDVPAADVGIVLSGTSLERQRLQRLGRILRRADGKRMANLYYLFVRETQEEHGYFPKGNEYFRTEDLAYENGDFSYPAYETAAERLLSALSGKNLSSQLLEETKKCLREGKLKNDWLLERRICMEMQNRAESEHVKNYWICMQRLRELA